MTTSPKRTGPRLQLVNLTRTSDSCPEQWTAIDLVSGDEFYARARHGKFRAVLSNPGVVRVVCEADTEPGSTGLMLEWCYADIPATNSAWVFVPKDRLR